MSKSTRTTTPRPPAARALGRVAYLAYWRVLAPLVISWEALSQREKRAWQAAARAAIATARAEQELTVTDTVTDTDAPQRPAPNAQRRKRRPVAY